MDGFTPWELATIKLVYHLQDQNKKGFLDFSDIRRICVLYKLQLSENQLMDLMDVMDANKDGHISFEEFLNFLSHSSSGSAAKLKIRAAVSSDQAALFAGTSFGLLHVMKGKLLLLLGAFFADPVRMFRDTYVDYASALKSRLERRPIRSTGASTAVAPPPKKEAIAELGLLGAIKTHRRVNRKIFATAGWVTYTVVLDSIVGVSMFLGYARAKMFLMDNQITMIVFNAEHMMRVEVVSGFVGGMVSGFFVLPCKYLSVNHINPLLVVTAAHRPLAFKGCVATSLRQGVYHGAFFATFYWSRLALSTILFQKLRVEGTTFRDALVTSTAGCLAGAAYRTVSVPAENWVRHSSAIRLRWSSAGSMWRMLWKGYGSSLIWTMPATGVVFLAYEMMLIRF